MDDIPKSHLQNMLELYMTSITITLSIQLSLMLYRKLKGNNDSIKDVDKKRTQVQNHQMSRARTSTTSSSQASKSVHKGPFARFIAGLTSRGDGTEYQEMHFDEMEEKEQDERNKPETAEAGCQVCQEIIQKRERRNRAHGGASSGDDGSEANESFTQDIFANEDTSSAAATAVELSEVKHTCAVCLDEDISLGSGNTTMTECGHVFHLTCLLKSLCQKNLCPMCRAPLEDVREKQMPANILTPVSAEQMIVEEISYFPVASHVHSMTLSATPRDRVHRAKEMLRIFSFTLLRTVAEYIHETNIPDGWYDDEQSEDNEDDQSEDDQSEDNEENEENEENDNEENEDDDNEENDNEENEENDNEENEENELPHRQGQIEVSRPHTRSAALVVLRRQGGGAREVHDLRELIDRR